MNIDKRVYGENADNNKNELLMIIGVAVCAVIILVLGVLCWALPQPTYSEYERRDLVQMPKFSFESLFAGEYTAQVELSFADTFAFRDGFVRLKGMVEEGRGLHISGALYGPAPVFPDEEDEPSVPSEETSSVTESSDVSNESQSEAIGESESSAPESSETDWADAEDNGENGETVAGIYIYKNMGFELFGGSTKMAEYYSSVINKYRDALPENVNIYNMVVPKHAEFALPSRFSSLSKSQKDSIDKIYSGFESGITAVDAYSVLKEHSKEYIYFNTDHHWTGLGAYYAYTAFMESAGLPYYDYSEYTKHTIEGFRGTLYSGTQWESLYNNPDYVEWCEFPVSYTAYQYKKGDLANYYETTVMASYAKGANAYGVYLGGDFPLTIVKTNVGNGRKCLIIKESYGNALSTYIASGFDETYIVDERYYDGNIVDLVKERGITDVLIINNVSAANTEFHIANIESLLTQTYSGSIAYPED